MSHFLKSWRQAIQDILHKENQCLKSSSLIISVTSTQP
jgi:hypothetical protein